MKKTFLVFVHGLSGWGSYDKEHRVIPYWGMRNGDLMSFLSKNGFRSYAASVSPDGSAWDRACELYAQIAGLRVDYGKVHSARNGHSRFGQNYTGRPLIPSWDDNTRLILIGHSFGGTTIRLFASMLKNGSPEERVGTAEKELSPFFKGGLSHRVHSIIALASPMNGTSIYDMLRDPDFDREKVKTPWLSKVLARIGAKKVHNKKTDRAKSDFADYEMRIDHALELNKRIETLPEVYYFSVPYSCCERQADGTYRPRGAEPFLVRTACMVGAYSGYTRGGFHIDESWRDNDGLVNTISAMAPLNAPSQPFDKNDIKTGIWNVCPVMRGDHMFPQGGMLHKHNKKELYIKLLKMVTSRI